MAESVYGVRDTLAQLKDIDPKLRAANAKALRNAAQPLARAIESHIPTSAPLSGMDHAGRTGWQNVDRKVKTVMPGRKRRGKDEWGLLSLKLVSAPLTMWDMAGKKGGGRFARSLSGSPSRAAWAPDREMQKLAEKAAIEAIEAMSKEVNATLVKKGSI